MTSLSLASVLAEAARRYPDKVGVVDGARRETYTELWRQARAYAAGLAELGVRRGGTVAMLVPNVLEFPRAYYGIIAAGATVVPVHLLLTADEMAYVLKDSHTDLLLCHQSQLAVGVAAAATAGVPIVAVGPMPTQDGWPPRLEDTASTVDPLPSFVTTRPEDPAVIFYTSGTTGQPKGALLTHFNLVMNATVSAFDTHDTLPTDVVLGALPLFHTFGQTVSMNCAFRLGGTLVLLPRFTGADAIDLMLRENVNVFHGVPTMYLGLLEAAAGRTELPALRLCISGGASLPVAVLEKFNAAFQTTIYEGYGLSETSPVATSSQPNFGGNRPGHIGHAIWGVDVEIARAEVDDRIELLPPDTLGEIVIRGHNVFAGYLDRPEATEQAIVDGWFRTGDLGTKSADGFLAIVDRKKDIVIRGGFNVYPREVEEVLARHPAVARVAVIGVPDETLGEEVCAVVVTEPGASLTGPELIEWSQEHMGRYKYPRHVRFVDELPMGPSMKVLKRELRRRYPNL